MRNKWNDMASWIFQDGGRRAAMLDVIGAEILQLDPSTENPREP